MLFIRFELHAVYLC